MKFGLSGGARATLAGFSPTRPLDEQELRGFEGKVDVFRSITWNVPGFRAYQHEDEFHVE
ncbi:MAG: hypothetical protein DMF20_03190 [Verrucomicrobia bacterium]|nr:MAG: hypothetical protein DME48_06740 [Verrucomicrobiota bacterium]PYL67538.1 MAG: hypothetical protein DMF20_03190 [Verrucomicrobiota bacterium]